jgi:hypothetical protein
VEELDEIMQSVNEELQEMTQEQLEMFGAVRKSITGDG